jgi:hypothetical protein
MALSSVTIARLAMFAGLGALGSFAQIVFALLAAALGGALLYVASTQFRALVIRKSARARAITNDSQTYGETDSAAPDAAMEEHGVEPFEATAGDGYQTFDQEIAEKIDQRAEDSQSAHSDDHESETEDFAAFAPETADHPSSQGDDALDLGVFDQVNEPALDPVLGLHGAQATTDDLLQPDEPEAQQPAGSGIEKLRQRAPHELSLIQLVERFAAALHEAQDAETHRASAEPAINAERDAILTEAIKALSLFTERGFDQAGDAPSQASHNTAPTAQIEEALGSHTDQAVLSETLAKLQRLQGVG